MTINQRVKTTIVRRRRTLGATPPNNLRSAGRLRIGLTAAERAAVDEAAARVARAPSEWARLILLAAVAAELARRK